MTDHTILIKRNDINAYPYGVTLSFPGDGSAIITAPMVPSGKVLYDWNADTDYLTERREPTLPLLGGGEDYLFSFDYKADPEGTAMFRLVFYDRQNEIVESLVTDTDSLSFTYPEDAYRYALELVQGGFDTLHFINAKLTSLPEEPAST